MAKYCYVYIDDIIIFSRTEDEHLSHIKKIFATLEEANIKFQRANVNFLKKKSSS